MSIHFAEAKDIVWFSSQSPVSYDLKTDTDPVVETAVGMFVSDMEAVTGRRAVMAKKSPTISVMQLDKMSASLRKTLKSKGVPVEQLDTLIDGFHISVHDGRINVIGSNGRGAAYGLLELSRMAGVSPWIWWGDVVPEKKELLTIDEKFSITRGASVEYRGIFLNDEDWSLRPWSSRTFEPNEDGTIGPKTYKEIFKLLMRLRANSVWPAMHPGTTAFFKNPLNKQMADSCGIAVGSSHCEPLLRNNVGEWDVKKRGAFNYMTNREAVKKYWTERLEEVKGSAGGNMFTIGMRGIHDGSMEGVKTMEEKFNALQQVIDDQQGLIAKHIGDPSKQMQVFVPYKEVLELYEQGLKVPEYVTLMWCDDNYGYITRLSDAEEQKRSGGAGVYYHLSYWGRPHDHLWLTTTQPGLIYNEMRTAYDHNVRKLWIANVHDPKVAAYDLSLFLDMAWDIDAVKAENVGAHLEAWLKTNFGDAAGERLYPVMRKFHDLTAKRKPEFMGWSQVELDKRLYNRGLSPVSNTEFNFASFGSEADVYMQEWLAISDEAEKIGGQIPTRLKDAYFASVLYPISASANHAVKILESQRARLIANGGSRDDINERVLRQSAAKSQQAYQNVRRLTDYYNNVMSDGKWRGSMSMTPRDLPVFGSPNLPIMLTDVEVEQALKDAINLKYESNSDGVIAFAAADFTDQTGDAEVVDMLGHSGRAVSLPKGESLTYEFTVPAADRYGYLTLAMIPTQPSDGGDLRFSVSVDGGEPEVLSLKETFRSEPWKKNVLRGQALRTVGIPELTEGPHTLTITALSDHIVADQWILDRFPLPAYYLIPSGGAHD